MKYYILLALALLFTHSACNSQNGVKNRQDVKDKTNTSASAGSVETLPPNSDHQPAFIGQTRINAVSTATPYTSEVRAKDLGRPWGIIEMPDGNLLITEKSGFMQMYSKTGQLVKKITGFPTVDNDGQGGLLDVALDPDYKINQTIYWSYSLPQDGGKNQTAVGKGRLNIQAGKIENPRLIFKADPAFKSNLHFGSRLVFDRDGNLFVSSGERSHLDGRMQAQKLSSGLGKIFKITREGKPAPGNPFLNTPDAKPEIYAYGIRNAQGLAIHPVTGDLWELEFGPRGGDEINIIRAGKDYGWPTITYGIEYSGKEIGKNITQAPGMEQPIYYWDPVISPSGISFYTSDQIPEWKNNLFIGCLSGQHIDRIVLNGNKVVGEERLLANEGERFRDVLCSPDGHIYAVTDSGKLYVVSKK